MRESFRHADFQALTDLWNAHCPDPYRIDTEVLRLNTIEHPLFDWGASMIDVDPEGRPIGFVCIKRSAAELFKGPDPDAYHLSAIVFPNCLEGVETLAFAKRLLRSRGISRLTFGGDVGHFFPGCPEECHQLSDFLTVEGFEESGEQFDVAQDLAKFDPRVSPSDNVKPCGKEDVPALLAFLDREFPGRWRWDTERKIAAEGRADFIWLLWVDGQIEGFAVTQDASHKSPVAGAVWRNGLGENWRALGPIGVSASVRGKGMGDALLATSLLRMKEAGGRQCLIDWTNLTDWYGKHGFTPLHRYRSFALRLD